MDNEEVQDLVPLVELLLKPLEKEEAKQLLQYLVATIGSGSVEMTVNDVKRAITREKNILEARKDGDPGGRPNIVQKYTEKYKESITKGEKEAAEAIRMEVKEKLSRSSYYKFCRSVDKGEKREGIRGRPTKIDKYVKEYLSLKENNEHEKMKDLIERAKNELSPSSYYKLLRDLDLSRNKGAGRPSKVLIYENAYLDHIRNGNPDFAESVLDYARSKISRSSYFKLKSRLRKKTENSNFKEIKLE